MSLSEAAVQAAIRIRAGERGIPLFRNNSGACEDKTGRLIRYGLANDSAQMNKRIKSGDLVGILPREFIKILPAKAIGEPCIHTVNAGVFLSVECKPEDWHANPARYNDRETAQAAWIELVVKHGGVAGFCRSVIEFDALTGV